MKHPQQQRAECGVSFSPDLVAGRDPFVIVEVERNFQGLTMAELRLVDENLHTAYKLAAFARLRAPVSTLAGEVAS